MVVSIFYEKFRLYFCFLKNESFFLNYKKYDFFFKIKLYMFNKVYKI